MPETNLNLRTNIKELVDGINKATQATQNLVDETGEYRERSLSAFGVTEKNVEQLNKAVREQKKLLREVEKEEKRLTREREKGKKVNDQVYKRVQKDARQYRRELDYLQKELKQVENQTKRADTASKNWTRTIGRFLTVATIGYVSKQFLDLAVSLDIVEEKARTVFGEYADDLDALASKTAITLGQTRAEYKKSVSAIGDLLVPMKFTRQEAFVMATGLHTLSGALAEWSAGTYDASEVSQILTKALLGEREQLKSLGISITEQDVQNKLLAKGTANLTGLYRKQAIAQATLELVYERSLDAQDAFGKGADSLRRQYAELNARLKTLRDNLATQMIPIFNQWFGFINDNLPTIIEMARWIAILTAGIITFKKALEISRLAVRAFDLTIKGSTLGVVASLLALLASSLTAWFSFKLNVDNATESMSDFNDELERTNEISPAQQEVLRRLIGNYRDLGLTIEEADERLQKFLTGLDVDRLQAVRKAVEQQIVLTKATIDKNEEELQKARDEGTEAEVKRWEDILKINRENLARLYDILDQSINRIRELTTSEIDLRDQTNAQLITKLKELNKIREDLLTDEQKELKKAVEFEIKIRKEAFEKENALWREQEALRSQLRENGFGAISQSERDALELLLEFGTNLDENTRKQIQFYLTGNRLSDVMQESLKKEIELYKQRTEALKNADRELWNLVDDYRMAFDELDQITMDDIEFFSDEPWEEATQRAEIYFNNLSKLTDDMIAKLRKLNPEFDKMLKFSEDHPLASILGIKDERELQLVSQGTTQIVQSIQTIADRQVEASERILGDLDTRISETINLLQIEEDKKREGYANDVSMYRETLSQLQDQRQKEIANREKALQKQKIIESATQTINLLTTASALIKEYGTSIIGLVIAGVLIGAMFALFSSARSSAEEATKFEMGGEAKSKKRPSFGVLRGKRHSQGGIPIEAEGGEYFVNRGSTQKYKPILEAINKDDRQDLMVAIKKEGLIMNPVVGQASFDIDDSKKLSEIINLLGKDDQVYVSDGYLIEKKKGYIKRTKLKK